MSGFLTKTTGAEWSKRLHIAMVVSCYFIVSISMVFINKLLLEMNMFIRPVPLFIMWFQAIMTVGIVYILGELKLQGQTPYSFDFNVSLKVMPLSFIFLGMIIFNQLCLQYVAVSFYNVARSLTIVFNVILSYFLLGQTTSLSAIASILIVILGFFLGIEGEIDLSIWGVIFGVLSSLFVALYSVYTSSALDAVNGDKNKLIFYNNINSIILMIPLIIYYESDILSYGFGNTSLLSWTMMFVAGIFGYLIGIVTMWQIQVTTPLTHNISGTAKASTQSVLALFIWRNPITINGALGLILTLGGSFAYSVVRMNQSAKEAAFKNRAPTVSQQTTYSQVLHTEETDDDEIFDSTPSGYSTSVNKV